MLLNSLAIFIYLFIFYQLPSEKTPTWEWPFMDVQSNNPHALPDNADGKSRTISFFEILNPATLMPTPENSLPFHSCLETLDHWTKP